MKKQLSLTSAWKVRFDGIYVGSQYLRGDEANERHRLDPYDDHDFPGHELAADNIQRLATTVRLSQKTISVIRQNYGIALGVNAGGIAIGALGFLNPFVAAALHNLSTLLAVFNSARLIRYDPDEPQH